MESVPRQTRFIEDLRDKHLGEEIWVLGCGPSLDAFPDDFFNDKITIALNWAIIGFPECTYWHGHHECFREYLRDARPEFLQKSIILFPFPQPRKDFITDPVEFFGELTSQVIWMRFGDQWPISKKVFADMVEDIMAGRRDCLYQASGTVAHTAVEAAAIMGARRIAMVGCEHSYHTASAHAQSRGMGAYYGPIDARGRVSDHKRGDCWLAELFGKHGVEVIRYFYEDVGPAGAELFRQGYQAILERREA